MPLVEVLPNTATTTSAPGWAYVPDTGFDPSKAAIVPSGARSRAKQASATGSGQLSVRQQNRITKRIADLDRENRTDIQIVVPNKTPRGKESKVKKKKMAKLKRVTTRKYDNEREKDTRE